MTTKPAARPAEKPRTPAKPKKERFTFIRGAIAELKKVTWLSRREVAYLTTIVLVAAIILGAVLGAIDYGFTALVDVLVGG